MTQIEVQNFHLQINTNWETTIVANQTKVKLYDELIEEDFIELGEPLERVEVEFKRWHFEQVKNYVNVLDVAYQWVTPNEETENDVGIEGEDRQVEEEGKLTEIVKKGKMIIANAYIVDIFNENEITSLSQLYF